MPNINKKWNLSFIFKANNMEGSYTNSLYDHMAIAEAFTSVWALCTTIKDTLYSMHNVQLTLIISEMASWLLLSQKWLVDSYHLRNG